MKSLLALILALASSSWGAIAIDGTATSTGIHAATPSLTFSHTTGSGSNRVLVVYTGNGVCPTNSPINNVTWNGIALTALTKTTYANPTGCQVSVGVFYLINPAASTTANVVVTFGASGGGTASAITLSGVDQTIPLVGFTGTLYAPSGSTTAFTEYTATGAANFLLCAGFTEDNAANHTTMGAPLTERTDPIRGYLGTYQLSSTGPFSITNTSTDVVYNQNFWEAVPTQDSEQLSPYMWNSNSPNMFPNQLPLLLKLFFMPRNLPALEADSRPVATAVTMQAVRSRLEYTEKLLSEGRITRTRTPTAGPSPTPALGFKTPTPTATHTPDPTRFAPSVTPAAARER